MKTLLFLLLLLPALATAETPPPVILILGDSLSAAYGIAAERGWPALLQTRLKKEKFPHRVANASVSGETTAGGLARIRAELVRHQPAVVVIALGGNDGLRGLSTPQMTRNLDLTVGAAKSVRVAVLLVGVRIPPNYGPDYTAAFEKVFGEVASLNRVPLVPSLIDGFSGDRQLFQSDGIHPTAQAQPKMLEALWPTLRVLLKKQAVAPGTYKQP